MPYRAAVAAALRSLASEPLAGKLLRGEYAGLRSLRIGVSRVIFHFDARKALVQVMSVEHRSTAYRR